MCGRYTLTADPAMLVDEFDATFEAQVPVVPRYNIAPTQEILIVTEDQDGRHIGSASWGLVPSWAKDRSAAARMINARSETAVTKPSFRSAVKRRRCLVPATGYYEWYRPERGAKQPFWIHAEDGSVLAMAGLYEHWTDPTSGEELRSVALLTQDATPDLAKIHDRMPVFIEHSAYGQWLNPNQLDGALALELALAPLLDATPIGPAVNNARNEGPQLLQPIEPEQLLW